MIDLTGAGGCLFCHDFRFFNEFNICDFTVLVGSLQIGWTLRDLLQLLLVDCHILGLAAAHMVLQDVIPIKALAALVALIRSVKILGDQSINLDFDNPGDSEQKV